MKTSSKPGGTRQVPHASEYWGQWGRVGAVTEASSYRPNLCHWEPSITQSPLYHLLLQCEEHRASPVPTSLPPAQQQQPRSSGTEPANSSSTHSWAGTCCIAHTRSGSVLHMCLTFSGTNYVAPARKHLWTLLTCVCGSVPQVGCSYHEHCFTPTVWKNSKSIDVSPWKHTIDKWNKSKAKARGYTAWFTMLEVSCNLKLYNF